VSDSGKLVLSFSQLSRRDLEVISQAQGVLDHFPKVSNGDCTPGTGGEFAGVDICEHMNCCPKLDVQGVEACITVVMEVAPWGDDGEVCTARDTVIDDRPDALPEVMELEEVFHHLGNGLDYPAELEHAASGSAPDLLLSVTE
jgi:hypothetical protein